MSWCVPREDEVVLLHVGPVTAETGLVLSSAHWLAVYQSAKAPPSSGYTSAFSKTHCGRKLYGLTSSQAFYTPWYTSLVKKLGSMRNWP